MFVGKPSALFDETNPDWAPSLRLGYSCKRTGAARHERAEKRRHEKRQAEFERHRGQAEAAIVDTAAEAASQVYAAADAPSSPQPVEDTDETEAGQLAFCPSINTANWASWYLLIFTGEGAHTNKETPPVLFCVFLLVFVCAPYPVKVSPAP